MTWLRLRPLLSAFCAGSILTCGSFFWVMDHPRQAVMCLAIGVVNVATALGVWG